MSKRRSSDSIGLPKGVYPMGERYKAVIWGKGEPQKIVAVCDTPDEAEYLRNVALNGTHWVGIEEGPYFGFIYRITHKPTGKMYIGKKQFYLWSGPSGGYKCTDQTDEWWDEKAWRPNAWEFYTGSQNDLNREILNGEPIWNYRFEVIDMCRNRLDCHLSEVMHQISEDVLEAVDENGHYLYYNKNIAGMEFRAPFRKTDLVAKRDSDIEAMRNYYLKPDLCSECHDVIPYGNAGCGCTAEPIPELQEGGDFEDVR